MNTIVRDITDFGICVHSRELDAPGRAYGPIVRAFWNGKAIHICESHYGVYELWESFVCDVTGPDAAESIAKAYFDRVERELWQTHYEIERRNRAMMELYPED